MRQPPGTLARYTTAARINHWITAACLILLALSGMALFHPSLFFLTALFGGGAYTRAIHPWFGSVLLVSFAMLFVRFVRHNLWERRRHALDRSRSAACWPTTRSMRPRWAATMPGRSWCSG